MKRILKALATGICLILALSFVACSDKTEKGETVQSNPQNAQEPASAVGAVVSYNGVEVDEAFFRSKVMLYKQDYLWYSGLEEDSSFVWEMPQDDGRTVGEVIVDLAVQDCAVMAWVVSEAEKNGITLTDEDRAVIDEQLASVEAMYGEHDEYVEFLTSLGFTEESARANEEFYMLYEKGVDLLSSEGQRYYISDEEIDAYFDANYVGIKHVYVNNVAEENADGSYVQISAESYRKQTERIEQIEKELMSGADFDALYATSDDEVFETYPDGIIVGIGDASSREYEEACFELEMNEWVRLDIADRGVYFIKRVELPEEQIEEKKAEVPGLLWTDVQDKIWEEYKSVITVNSEYIDSFDIMSVGV